MKYTPQYVNYNLLVHFLFLTSSYVLVSVLYIALGDKPRVLPGLGFKLDATQHHVHFVDRGKDIMKSGTADTRY